MGQGQPMGGSAGRRQGACRRGSQRRAGVEAVQPHRASGQQRGMAFPTVVLPRLNDKGSLCGRSGQRKPARVHHICRGQSVGGAGGTRGQQSCAHLGRLRPQAAKRPVGVCWAQQHAAAARPATAAPGSTPLQPHRAAALCATAGPHPEQADPPAVWAMRWRKGLLSTPRCASVRNLRPNAPWEKRLTHVTAFLQGERPKARGGAQGSGRRQAGGLHRRSQAAGCKQRARCAAACWACGSCPAQKHVSLPHALGIPGRPPM